MKPARVVLTALAAMALASCSTPGPGIDREPLAETAIETDTGETYCQPQPDGESVCVVCRTYPIFHANGSLARRMEICR